MSDTVKGAFVFTPVGICIYCGATRHSELRAKLGDEHIVPEVIGGNLLLPLASCGRCEGLTTPFEQFYQKQMLGALRYKLNMPSKRPRERPKFLPISLHVGGQWKRFEVSVEEYSLVLFVPNFPLPGLLSDGDNPAHRVSQKFFAWDLSSEETRARLLRKHGATYIRSNSRASVNRFGRTLARVF